MRATCLWERIVGDLELATPMVDSPIFVARVVLKTILKNTSVLSFLQQKSVSKLEHAQPTFVWKIFLKNNFFNL